MGRGKTPYGYRIQNGEAVICEEEAAQILKMFEGYLAGLSLISSAREAGLKLTHSSVKGIMKNRHLQGDDFYPAIIKRETYDAFEAERIRRQKALGRDGIRKKTVKKRPSPVYFRIKDADQMMDDPYEQAGYIYSLIESEVCNGDSDIDTSVS